MLHKKKKFVMHRKIELINSITDWHYFETNTLLVILNYEVTGGVKDLLRNEILPIVSMTTNTHRNEVYVK